MENATRDTILAAVDIVDVVGESVALRRKGKEFIGLCPFHADKNPSLNVSPAKQIFKCFACGAGGDAIRFIQLKLKLSFVDAMELLARRAGLDFRRGGPRDSGGDRDQLEHVLRWASAHFQRNLAEPIGRGALDYARSRGLDDATLSGFQIGYATEDWDGLYAAARRAGVSDDLLLQAGLVGKSENGKVYDRFRGRLMFPITDRLDRLVAFGGRTLIGDDAKYLNSPETRLFSKSSILFGLSRARPAIADTRTAVVVEGYMDCVLLHQFGFRNIVATLGTALTEQHVRQLRSAADRILLCFDGDAAGVKAADRALEVSLRSKAEVCVVALEGGLDPADYVVQRGVDAFSGFLHSAIPALEFKWKLAEDAARSGGSGAQRAAIEELVSFVARVAGEGGVDPIEQGLLVGRLSAMLSLPADTVYGMLRRAMSTGRRDFIDDTDRGGDARSAYEGSVSALSPALVAVAEEMFGWILADPACLRRGTEAFGRAVKLAEPWRRLYALISDLSRDLGDFTREDVIAACDSAESAELVSRCLARVDESLPAAEGFDAGAERLEAELAGTELAALRQELVGVDPSGARGNEALLGFFDAARRRGRSGILNG